MNVTWDKLIKNGVFFALFVSLLAYVMNENHNREAQYQATIKQVNETNAKYADIIKIDLTEIKAKLK
jgi:hypothetical protein